MYQKFVGIDIGKETFYVAFHLEKEVHTYANTAEGFEQFYDTHQGSLQNALVVLETTGGYELPLIHFLQKRQHAVHRANTRKVKYFIRSLGKLGKSDSIDALGLSHYAFERATSLPLFTENPDKILAKLVNRRNELKHMVVQEKNRAQAPDQEDLQESFERIIAFLTQQIECLDEKIECLCLEHPSFNQQKEVIKTIPGIGNVLAIQLLALLPELGHLDRKQIASLAGLAPHPNESGKKVGYRSTRGGRPEIKPILFIAAMAASRSHSHLASFYQKLLSAGKKKMVALTALMRKILVIANARLRDFYSKKNLAQHS